MVFLHLVSELLGSLDQRGWWRIGSLSWDDSEHAHSSSQSWPLGPQLRHDLEPSLMPDFDKILKKCVTKMSPEVDQKSTDSLTEAMNISGIPIRIEALSQI